MSKQTAVFASLVLALAGANLLQLWSLLATFLFADTLPGTTFFAIVFWFWVATSIVAVWCGLSGGYELVRGGSIRAGALTTFAVMSCLMIKVGATELGYSSVRFGLNLGLPQFRIGVNVLGLALVWWLFTLRRDAPPLSANEEVQVARGRGAV